jgi:hypothetical protein
MYLREPHGAKDRFCFARLSAWVDYTVYDHGRTIGRIYEDRALRPALRWFWSITMIGARHTGIRTDGCTPTLDQAKAELQANWRKLILARLEEPTPND